MPTPRASGPGPDDAAAPAATSWSVRTYLVLLLGASVVAAAAAVGSGFAWSTSAARNEALADMTLLADRGSASIADGVAHATSTVEGLLAQPNLETVFTAPEGCQLSVDGGQAFPSVRVDLVRADGQVMCTSEAAPAITAPSVHAGSAWLDETLRAASTMVIRDATDAATGKPAIAVAAPLGPGESRSGVVVAWLHLPETAASLAADYGATVQESYALVDGDRTVLSTSVLAGSRPPADLRFPGSEPEGEWRGLDGIARIFGSSAVPDSDWRVYAAVPSATVLADARSALTRQSVVGVVALLLVLAAAVWVLDRRVAGPLRTITAAMARASEHPGAGRVAEAGAAEVVTLAREFNAMLDIRAGHEAQLEHQATHDPLTGLPNRVLLHDRLTRALSRDDIGAGVAVLSFDIDRFKDVNDSLGHDLGDRLLVEVAGRLSAELRPDDTLARFGGDVFVMLCQDMGAGDAVRVAARLHHCLDQPFSGPTSDLVLEASVGIAVARRAPANAAQLLREVDIALHHAKRSGDSSCLFDESLQARATQHLEIEHALRGALERGELFVEYQPILDVGSGRTIGAEALVRWQHAERGVIPPMEFIPVAEATGQIAAIGRFVLREACRQAAAWEAAGHVLRMSVNVAVAQLASDDMPATVARVLAETGLPPDRLCLEITESSLASETSSRALHALRRLGVKVAIDDFGTGYSSLSYLHELPVDELKIDRSFISRVGVDSRDVHLLEAIIGMARALGLTVVAEGVETSAQLDTLARLRYHLAQGYLFAAPQRADEFLTRLGARPTPLSA